MRLLPYRGTEDDTPTPVEDALFAADTPDEVRAVIGKPKTRVASVQPMEFGDVAGHEFHGNQWVKVGGSGFGRGGNDSVVGFATAKGLAGQNALRDAMLKGTSVEGGTTVSSLPLLSQVSDEDRIQAKGDLVQAAAKDIGDAARNDPAVKEEYEAWLQLQKDTYKGADWAEWQNLPPQEHLDKLMSGEVPWATENQYGLTKAQEYVDQWAQSAADSELTSLSLQRATADVLDAHSDSFDSFLQSSGGLDAEQKSKLLASVDVEEGDTMRAFVQGTYDRTQSYLKDLGITEVTLYRGVGFGKDDPPSPFHKDGVYNIDMNPASSWSVDQETAQDFMGDHDNIGNNFLLTATVPAKDIISTARTGQGALIEGEVVVRNQPDSQALVVRRKFGDANAPDIVGPNDPWTPGAIAYS